MQIPTKESLRSYKFCGTTVSYRVMSLVRWYYLKIFNVRLAARQHIWCLKGMVLTYIF